MSDSIGARLRQARELRHLTIREVSETTKLRTHYLQALETDDYSAIPSAAQARGFLRLYAEFLELDVAELLPPAAPEEPVPVEAPQAVKPATAGPARGGLLDGLRKRFSRPKKDEAVQDLPLSAPASLAPDASAVPTAQETSVPASTEAQTTRRRKADSQKVKKNAVS